MHNDLRFAPLDGVRVSEHAETEVFNEHGALLRMKPPWERCLEPAKHRQENPPK